MTLARWKLALDTERIEVEGVGLVDRPVAVMERDPEGRFVLASEAVVPWTYVVDGAEPERAGLYEVAVLLPGRYPGEGPRPTRQFRRWIQGEVLGAWELADGHPYAWSLVEAPPPPRRRDLEEDPALYAWLPEGYLGGLEP